MIDREVRAFGARFRKLSKVIGEADLTQATVNVVQDVLLGVLPAGAIVLGRAVNIATFFTGGGATNVTVAIGTGSGGVANSIMTALTVFSTTATGVWLPGTSGASPQGLYDAASIYAEFAPDATHSLAGLTAGSLTVEVFYAVATLDADI
jgi:hypothetical protein